MTRIPAVFLLGLGLAAAAGCERTPTSPTPTTPGVTSVTQVFSGTLAPGDAPSHTFTIPGTQQLHVTFGSLTGAAGMPLGSGVTLVFGLEASSGTACDPLISVPATAALKSQIAVIAAAGVYCVALADTAGVPASANYAIRLIYGTPTDVTSAGTISYSSLVLPGGFTSRTFHAAFDGTATLTMESIAPAGVSSLGLGLGYPRNDGSGCEVSSVVTATRGTVFSVPVDAGRYCVRVFDQGILTDPATFTIRIDHP